MSFCPKKCSCLLLVILIFKEIFGFSTSHNPDDVKFLLFHNKSNPATFKEIVYLNQSTLSESGFLVNTPIAFISHGYFTNSSSPSIQIIKNAFLKSDMTTNVIMVDWGKLSNPHILAVATQVGYLEAVNNVPIVGKRVADLIKWLIADAKVLSSPSQVHLVGHSLGAHLSGTTGSYFKREEGVSEPIGRISGLDPAGPLWHPPIQVEHVLNQNDAIFVDVTHTNQGALGTLQESGHIDFYPNGGSVQPECKRDPTQPPSCSHSIAGYYFAASFFQPMIACKCPDPVMGKLGKCVMPCLKPTPFGISVDHSARGKYYFSTSNMTGIFPPNI